MSVIGLSFEILKCDPVVYFGIYYGGLRLDRWRCVGVFVYGQVLNLADVTRCVFYLGVPVDVSRFLVKIGLI